MIITDSELGKVNLDTGLTQSQQKLVKESLVESAGETFPDVLQDHRAQVAKMGYEKMKEIYDLVAKGRPREALKLVDELYMSVKLKTSLRRILSL